MRAKKEGEREREGEKEKEKEEEKNEDDLERRSEILCHLKTKK